jgi:hypothetical protein
MLVLVLVLALEVTPRVMEWWMTLLSGPLLLTPRRSPRRILRRIVRRTVLYWIFEWRVTRLPPPP